MQKRYLLFIPEARKKPITKSLLYRQIINFFEAEGIEDRFDIVFISIADGIVEAKGGEQFDYSHSKVELPPRNFRAGHLWISKKIIEEMAENIAKYLYIHGNKYNTKIAYVRGSYLEAVKQVNRLLGEQVDSAKNLKTCRPIDLIFSDDELSELKKKGWLWMKVGLRMSTPFIIFRMKIKYMIMDDKVRQLRLF